MTLVLNACKAAGTLNDGALVLESGHGQHYSAVVWRWAARDVVMQIVGELERRATARVQGTSSAPELRFRSR
jgi:hypothetical protein